MSTILRTKLNLPSFGRGKVRDTYQIGDKLLIIATDRISAFDVVLPSGIPDKGIVLNQISAFWFARTYHVVHNHMVESIESPRALKKYSTPRFILPESVLGRSMVVFKAKRIPVECVVRGYIAGSAWSEYAKSGTVNGIKVRKGLKESQELPEPLFTPTTKAEAGHDLPMSKKELANLVGKSAAAGLEEKSIALYQFARDFAIERGIIIADTKFEFGYVDDEIVLIDELLTPDSSRFWDASRYKAGRSQPSYDKQFVRDWLIASGWDQKPPAPALPKDIILSTAERYRQAYFLLTGRILKNVFS
ncbi:MAG: phosphoribosylaminoimidazolesuccinocarboxamide synthase [Dehalococcoidia bacterium]|nr:phosphoribosylaminoimidazolesuccinocarboxamide synthase [Dehalococcoidia bacterium]MDD5493394.1 phosphoribosylaminoimidazolesuccinocarboxamide synthase [Dehalococcoidia bacterium]